MSRIASSCSWLTFKPRPSATRTRHSQSLHSNYWKMFDGWLAAQRWSLARVFLDKKFSAMRTDLAKGDVNVTCKTINDNFLVKMRRDMNINLQSSEPYDVSIELTFCVKRVSLLIQYRSESKKLSVNSCHRGHIRVKKTRLAKLVT